MWEWPSSIWVSFLIAPFHVTTPLKIRPYGATEISLLLLFFVSIMFGHTPHIYHGQLKCKYVCCNVSNVKSIFRIVLLARIMSNLLLVSPYRVSTAVISQCCCVDARCGKDCLPEIFMAFSYWCENSSLCCLLHSSVISVVLVDIAVNGVSWKLNKDCRAFIPHYEDACTLWWLYVTLLRPTLWVRGQLITKRNTLCMLQWPQKICWWTCPLWLRVFDL